MKLSRLQRILKMVNILQAGRHYSPAELAEYLGVTRRTIFRDLDMLRQAGIPYYHDDENGGYKIDDTFLLPPLNLNLQEALALMLMTQNEAASFPLRKQTLSAALKIESSLPAHIRQHCGSLLKKSSIHPQPYTHGENQTKIFSTLQQAVKHQRKVQIDYRSFYEKKKISTTISPYHLHFAQRGWYVIGYSSLHNELRTFKISRMENLCLLPSRFLQDKSFRIDEYLSHAWSLIPEGKIYHVILRFLPKVAGNVAEVLWHRTQQITRLPGGSIQFEVHVDGLTEIFWWILGYGDQVEVISPRQLKKRVAQTARNILKLYQSHSADPLSLDTL